LPGESDLALRSFMNASGMKKVGLSTSVEDAVRRTVLQRTIEDIRAYNAGRDGDEIQRIVDQAVREVRAERRSKRKG